VLIDGPVEKPANENQPALCRSACDSLLAVDDLKNVAGGDLADWPLAPCRDKYGAQFVGTALASTLARQLLGNEGFGNAGKRGRTRNIRSRSAFSRASASTTAGSTPLPISERHSPAVILACSSVIAP
jgi:hypothetical protein